MSAPVRIVLVEPREAGNIGAVCRAMKNFGISDLVIVGDHPRLENSNAMWWSSGAEDLMEHSRRVETLHEAIADVEVSVATTSARARNLMRPLTPEEVGQLRARLSDKQRIAIVFGREDRGLSAAETGLCQHTAVVQTDAAFPVLNLAQAVAIFSYELSKVATPRSQRAPEELVSAGLLERLHERAASLLLEVGFLQENNPDRIYEEIRALLTRAELTTREASLLLALLRQVEWKLHALAAGV